MTACMLTTLTCDRRLPSMTAPRQCRRLFDFRGSLEQARTEARRQGWAATGFSDFCPDHAINRQETP